MKREEKEIEIRSQEALKKKRCNIQTTAIETKRVAAQLLLMAGQLDRLANNILAQTNEKRKELYFNPM